jgi:hypothetical protein
MRLNARPCPHATPVFTSIGQVLERNHRTPVGTGFSHQFVRSAVERHFESSVFSPSDRLHILVHPPRSVFPHVIGPLLAFPPAVAELATSPERTDRDDGLIRRVNRHILLAVDVKHPVAVTVVSLCVCGFILDKKRVVLGRRVSLVVLKRSVGFAVIVNRGQRHPLVVHGRGTVLVDNVWVDDVPTSCVYSS